MSDSSGLAALRGATRASHLATHDVAAMCRLLSARLDRPAYLTVLCRLWGWVEAVERAVPPDPAFAPARLPDLRADLVWLGLTPAALAALPACSLPADIAATPAARLGVAYVLQGSRHGGGTIAGHLRTTLGLGPDSGAAFLSSGGRDWSGPWAALLARIETELTDADARESAATAAVATFDAFLEWLA